MTDYFRLTSHSKPSFVDPAGGAGQLVETQREKTHVYALLIYQLNDETTKNGKINT